MGPKRDSLLYAIMGSLLRNRFVLPLWIPTVDTQGRRSPFRQARSLVNKRVLSRFVSILPLSTAAFSAVIAERKAHG